MAELQTVDPDDLSEAVGILSSAEDAPVVIRPRLARTILAALKEQASIIDRNERTSRQRRLAFDAALSSVGGRQ